MTSTSNVLVGVPDKVSGGIYFSTGLLDSAAYPTSDIGTTPLPPELKAAGFIGEDGVTEANESDTEKIKAWGGDTVRVVQNEHTVTYTFSFLEFGNTDVLKALYGEDNVTESGEVITANLTSDVLEHRSWLFEMKDGDNRIRVFVPDGQITTRGEINYTHAGAIMTEVTIEAFPDADGKKAIKVIARPEVTSP